ncbi:hypothetical protein TWF217_007866 [Orbilia oligospora]|nr:hypothetical protein TWF751_006244 [Orbilia oligospora]KAF3245425.1 hypothetical protein TWF128_009454 [Orbilia oligospora]KAF3251880.1 hypothetical protein TWF217_007866 [Orbilia oligospora]
MTSNLDITPLFIFFIKKISQVHARKSDMMANYHSHQQGQRKKRRKKRPYRNMQCIEGKIPACISLFPLKLAKLPLFSSQTYRHLSCLHELCNSLKDQGKPASPARSSGGS